MHRNGKMVTMGQLAGTLTKVQILLLIDERKNAPTLPVGKVRAFQ